MADAEPDDKRAQALLLSYPALLWSERWPELHRWIAGQPQDTAARLRARLETYEEMGAAFERAIKRGEACWPDGVGPIEDLATKLAACELPLDAALARAAAPDIAWSLSPIYVASVASRAAGRAIDGQWQEAVSFMRLLLAAADSYGEGPASLEIRSEAVSAWLTVASAACHAVPDGRLFYNAKARGDALVAANTAAGRMEAAAWALHRLGVLHLDPYTDKRDSRILHDNLGEWRQRFADTYGAAAADHAVAMPDVIDALDMAVAYFDRALPTALARSAGAR